MIAQIAMWLSKPVGFVFTCCVVMVGLIIGVSLDFNDHWSLIFNLILSIAALLIAGLILVAGAKDTASLHAKLDELIRVTEADNSFIGLDQQPAEEVERARSKPVR